MNDDYAYLMEKYGAFSASRPATAEQLSRLAALLGPAYAQFIAEVGFGIWDHGRVQLVDPQDYAGLVPVVFGGVSRYRVEDVHLIAYSAGCTCVFWNPGIAREIVINLVDLIGTHPQTLGAPHEREILLVNALSGFRSEMYDVLDARGKPVTRQVIKRLGPLSHGECLAHAPAIALGGAREPNAMQKVAALEHMSFLAQLGELTDPYGAPL
jgi:hypothetical protein